MPVLAVSDMADLVALTRKEEGALKFNQIAQSIQYYEIFSKWFKKDKIVFESGQSIQRNLMTSFDATAAAHVGLGETDQVNTPDVVAQMNVPWRHAKTAWGIWYQTDILMNRGKSLILNVLQPRRVSALLALVEELETRAWGTAPGVNDKKLPYSIQYWLVENSTTGFNGGLPTGHTAKGGIDTTVHTNFKNYTALYTTANKADLVKKLRTAHRSCRFMSPVTVPDYRAGLGERYRFYTNETTLSSLEDIGEGQNENLGRDIASMDGTIVFRRNPVIWVPQLDARSDGPIYMIDHSTFFPACLKGNYLRESAPKEVSGQHNVYSVFVDLSYNYVCDDLRRNAVLTTSV